jgi:hypothetical protein
MKSQSLLHTCVMSPGLLCEKNQIHLLCQYGDQADMTIYKGTQYGDWADVKISKVAQ